MSWESRLRDSFEFARDSTRQVLTLASALLGASVSLFGAIAGDRVVTNADMWRLRASWAFLGISVLCGVVELFTIVRVASPTDASDTPQGNPSVYDHGLRIWSGLQLITFIVGVGIFTYFGMKLIDNAPLANK